jgi:hypothetical protein
MRGFVLAAIVAAPLAACANLPQTAATDSNCRHVLSPQGDPLRFCETGDNLTVDDKPIDTERTAEARLIDDPKFLAAMMAQLPKPKTLSQRRNAAPQICKSAQPGYITIATSDFADLIHARADIPNIDTDAVSSISAEPLTLHTVEPNASHR